MRARLPDRERSRHRSASVTRCPGVRSDRQIWRGAGTRHLRSTASRYENRKLTASELMSVPPYADPEGDGDSVATRRRRSHASESAPSRIPLRHRCRRDTSPYRSHELTSTDPASALARGADRPICAPRRSAPRHNPHHASTARRWSSTDSERPDPSSHRSRLWRANHVRRPDVPTNANRRCDKVWS